MNQFNLREIFGLMQQEMALKLRTNRTLNVHQGTKGSVTESQWRRWLQDYLPMRYCVSEAFIVDSNNQCSEQIDLVIYDRQYSPFVWTVDGAKYIPAESVYAVFEIKQTLNRENFEYAGKKISSVRVLNRTNAPIYHAGGCIKDPAPPFTILGGILTLDTKWTEPFGESFVKAIEESEPRHRLDIGCVLDCGAFSINYLEESHSRQISTTQESLIYFFLKLLARLQRMGTVPAIDIEEYARALDSM